MPWAPSANRCCGCTPPASVGGSTALVATNLVAARVHRTVLTLAFEKQSESNAMWGLSLPVPFQQPLLAGCRMASSPRTSART